MKRFLALSVSLVLCLTAVSCTGQANAATDQTTTDLKTIQTAIGSFTQLKNGQLIGTDTISTANKSITGMDTSSTFSITFSKNKKHTNYVQTTLNVKNAKSAYTKRVSGKLYTSTDQKKWTMSAKTTNAQARNNMIEMLFGSINKKDIDKIVVTTDGTLTGYQIVKSIPYINAHELNTSMKELDYKYIEQNTTYWIDGNGLIVKATQHIVSQMTVSGKTDTVTIERSIELVKHDSDEIKDIT